MSEPIYTIGHSTHPIETFLELLEMHGVTAVCDVRSKPYSRMNPQFNREALRDILHERNIEYVYLGKELGARSDDPACYRDGKVQYETLSKTPLFVGGLERVIKGAEKFRVALMCAEKEPLDCHRTILVGRNLFERGAPVRHILADGGIEDHEQSEERLLQLAKINARQTDMFRSRDDMIRDAYRLQGQAIAYSEEETDASAEAGAEREREEHTV